MSWWGRKGRWLAEARERGAPGHYLGRCFRGVAVVPVVSDCRVCGEALGLERQAENELGALGGPCPTGSKKPSEIFLWRRTRWDAGFRKISVNSV